MTMAGSNILRIGKISSINYKNGTARVAYEDLGTGATSEMPFISWIYWMPRVGDQVLVAHLSNGTSRAVIVGPVWHGDARPYEGAEGLYRFEYSNTQNKAFEKYTDKDGKFQQKIDGDDAVEVGGDFELTVGGIGVKISADGSVSITGASTVTVDASTAEFSGDVKVKGSISTDSNVTAKGDVKAGAVSLKTHTHISNVTGVPSQTPTP